MFILIFEKTFGWVETGLPKEGFGVSPTTSTHEIGWNILKET